MDAATLQDVLRRHRAWLTGEDGGKRADLRRANLAGANLADAELADADLADANLTDANLRRANLAGADLADAELARANLTDANLRRANFADADLADATLSHFRVCPEEGAFIAWKTAGGCVLKLEIPAEAARTSALVGRKCRAAFVRVLAGWRPDGSEMSEGETVRSERGGDYTIGGTTHPDRYCDDIRIECSHGIHFFITRREAEEWAS